MSTSTGRRASRAARRARATRRSPRSSRSRAPAAACSRSRAASPRPRRSPRTSSPRSPPSSSAATRRWRCSTPRARGCASVREYLRDRVAELDGVRPADGELMVTSGGIECMELVARSLLDPGDVVVVESPTYLGAIMAFRGYEADLHAVPMDDDGLCVDVLADRVRAGTAAEARLRHPRAPEPDRPHALGRAPAGARRAGPRLRLLHPRGRRLPRDRLRRGGPAVAVVAGARARRAGRHVLQGVLPGRTAGLGRRAPRSSSHSSASPSRTPTSAPAPSGSASSRSTGAQGTSARSCARRARSTRGAGR